MLNDPEFDKMIIYGLAGVCLVLLLAVIFLAVKRNIYYVDEDGREVPPPAKPLKIKFFADKKQKQKKEEPVSEPVYTEEPVAEPAAEQVIPEEVIEPSIPVFETPDAFPEEPEAEEDVEVTRVMSFETEPAVTEQPSAEIPVIEEEEPEPLRALSFDEEPEEEDIFEEETPAVIVPKPTGLTVTVTVAGQSETHEIDQLPCLIGREQTSCNLVISEPAVSRRHARIYVNEDGLFIEDVSEHNGTYVNGTKLPSLGSAPLKEDDRVSLGRAEITVNRILY